MKVGECMTRDVRLSSPDETLREAEQGLLKRFGEITIQALAQDFERRFAERASPMFENPA